MKTIKLSYKQGMEVCWNNKEIRVSQNGLVCYVRLDYSGRICAVDMSGNELDVHILNEFTD